MKALFDTSVLVDADIEQLKSFLDVGAAISVVTVAELGAGIQLAKDPQIKSVRLRTYNATLELFEPLPFDLNVAQCLGALIADCRKEGRRPKYGDAVVAATAICHNLRLVTRDSDFVGMPGVKVKVF